MPATQGLETQGLKPADLGRTLVELEEALATALPSSELGRLAPPADLHQLFCFELAVLVRRGPADGHGLPRRLVECAQAASKVGVLPARTPLVLRHHLERLERDLHTAGAWDPASPAWWMPLPEPSPVEELWTSLGRRYQTPCVLPPKGALAAAFTGAAAPRWLAMPALLEPAFVEPLAGGLEAAWRDGRLELEREGVGAKGAVSERRADEVAYLTGFEPELLDAVPALQVFVQWALHHFARRWRRALPGEPLYSPGRAMLARYPAPSAGYAAHLDNPGGKNDNGRSLTLVVYLNTPEAPPSGGELALWPAGGSTEGPPAAELAPVGGTAVVFDAREIAHQVRPLNDGPPRWALTLWFNDRPTVAPPLAVAMPRVGLTDVLLPIAEPPVPPGRVLVHELSDEKPDGQVVVRPARSWRPEKPRVGIVTTVYRAGARLEAWCAYHLGLGFDHLAVVFDHLEDPEEEALAERLRTAWGPERLTVWSSAGLEARWHALPKDRYWDDLLHFARLGSSSWAIAARQTLNASTALEAARGDELGGVPLDWLFHLDADELFYLEGRGRGGSTLEEHLAAAESAGLKLLRYVNHEVLLPLQAGSPPRFKVNPRLAAARLGRRGWRQLADHLGLAEDGPRPYFNGYLNGKSAVSVGTATGAAGVHGFALSDSSTPGMRSFLAGPSVLHFHFQAPESFRRKYLDVASAPVPQGQRLFEPSPTETAAVGLIRALRAEGADDVLVNQKLEELHTSLTHFSDGDVLLLEEAGLVLEPKVAIPEGFFQT